MNINVVFPLENYFYISFNRLTLNNILKAVAPNLGSYLPNSIANSGFNSLLVYFSAKERGDPFQMDQGFVMQGA
jgi:hypothetical protein